jgi:plastocyanin
MRALLLPALVLALAAPASAENFSVKTTSANGFTPQELTVKPGDSVTFSNPTRGFHNVKWVEGTFDDGQQASPSSPATIWPTDPTRTFSAEGTFRYYCEQHGTPEGAGMAGTVTVSASTAPPPDETPPVLTHQHAGVRKHRPFFSFTSVERVTVVATLFRQRPGADRQLARLEREVPAGDRTLRFARRELKPGRYYVAHTESDAAGNVGPRAKVRFRVR